MKRILNLSASVLALTCCTAAYAADAAKSDGGVETVVVTAERRTENLQKTSISATVLNAQDISNKNIVTVDQLQFSAPSVAVDNFGQGNDFNIRGIGKGEHNSQTSTGVITYRDGVETYPGYIQEEPYYDIASIEILRGPQGTFVGSNATGGAVFVTSNNPIVGGDYDGYVMGNVGNYSEYGSQGAINLPISDTLAARISYFGDSRDSFYHITDNNPADACPGGKYAGCKPGYNPGDVRWAAGRVSLLWKPTEALSVLFKSDLDYLDSGAYPADSIMAPGSTVADPILATNDPFHISANAPQGGMDREMRYSLKVDYAFDNGITFRSITAYQDSNSRYRSDLDGTDSLPLPPPLVASDETFYDSVDTSLWSQEFNLISPDTGRVTWVLGGFAQWLNYNYLSPYQFDIDLYQPIYFPAYNYRLQGTNPESTYAAFGQVSAKLTDNLKLDVGARYTTHSTKNDVDVLQYGSYLRDDQSARYNNVSYKVALDWTVNDDNFVYGFVATGFKPGGLNVPFNSAIVPAPFKSERVTSFETGWKSTLLDGHLLSNIDAYYNDFDNFQVTIGYPDNPTFGFEVNNPNTTKLYGVEAEEHAVFGQLSFDLGLGLMHSELGTFYAVDTRVLPTGVTPPPCDPKTGPSGAYCLNLGGNPQSYAPNFTFNVGGQYVFALGNGQTLTPRVNYGHVSEQWATLFDNAAYGDRLGQRNILGAQLAWSRGNWTATLYGTNLTDQHYIAAANSGVRWAGAPRQFGFSLLRTF
ncbi:MAG TPA: TonB-dependent receptor [Rhizomicrobium sp.]|nr:TonB-dependent receptor [Rhizomicrobium sp.]